MKVLNLATGTETWKEVTDRDVRSVHFSEEDVLVHSKWSRLMVDNHTGGKHRRLLSSLMNPVHEFLGRGL